MRIKTNVPSLEAQRSMSEHNRKIESSLGRLSSGIRILKAADDPASLAIGLTHKSQVISQGQAMRNANNAVSEIQVAEGALNEVSSMLVRLKELSIQGANGTLGQEDRWNLNQEYMQIRREIERTLRATHFNGQQVFRPRGDRDYQVGTHAGDSNRITIDTDDLILSEFNLRIVDSHVETAEDARLNLVYLEDAMQKVTSTRAKLGSFQNRLSSTINNLGVARKNESEAYSRRMDTDYAAETSELLRAQGKLAATTSVLAQTNDFGKNTLKLLKDQS